jgi:SprT protein
MLLSDGLEQRLEAYLELCVQRAQVFYELEFRYASVEFGLRGQSAGQLRFKREVPSSRWSFSKREPAIAGAYFRFNAQLLQSYQQAFIDEVVPHEVAHLVAYTVFGVGIKPHGLEWKQVMVDVYKREPNVRHQFDVPSAKRKTFPYLCGCEDRVHELSIIRHNRVSRARAIYKCRACKHDLVQPA